MKNLYITFMMFIFVGCGESESGNTLKESLYKNSLFYQQWSINHDESFYEDENIDEDAHINAQNSLVRYTGKGVKVAVIDNGFDVNHPEIKDKIIATVSVGEYGDVLGTDVSQTLSSEFHGTAVSGIIAASDNNTGIRGIAPNAELILIKMPDNLSDTTVIELFDQAISYDADIINCSWGTNNISDTVRSYLKGISSTARDGKGVIIVFASGNYDINMEDDESSVSTVIGVGATDHSNLRTSYSNYGKDLDIVAPGGGDEYGDLGITTIDPLGSNGASRDEYLRFDELYDGVDVSFIGTSASAPIISGVIALALEKDPSLTREEVQEILKYSTSTIGRNTPYLDEMITSSSTEPTITGLLGTTRNSQFKVKLTLSTGIVYGPYDITLVNDDNSFESIVTETLPEGNYKIELVDSTYGTISDTKTIFATDEDYEINTSKASESNPEIKKSDFYGHGKIDVDKFLDNI